jgi:endonuclease/exonuclease/phosphatase family metal-dependent hydrolase
MIDSGALWEPAEPPPRRRRKFGGRLVTVLMVLVAGGFACVALFRLVVSGLFGWDGFGLTAAALALTPYLAGAGFVLAALIALFRRWGSVVLVLALSAALGLMLLPRMFGDAQPGTGGPELRVLAVNLYYGEADLEAVVDLVREHDIDVLTLQELTPDAMAGLASAGLDELLPNQAFEPQSGADGSGIASRHPLIGLSLAEGSTFQQPSASVELKGGVTAEVVAVHAVPPVTRSDWWRSDLRGLPAADKQGAVRVLAGDFNASLDHAEFRDVLDNGYVDAADQFGEGLTATWPQQRVAPPVTLDHVLVDSRAAVTGFDVLDVRDSDHRAVLAALRLPRD